MFLPFRAKKSCFEITSPVILSVGCWKSRPSREGHSRRESEGNFYGESCTRTLNKNTVLLILQVLNHTNSKQISRFLNNPRHVFLFFRARLFTFTRSIHIKHTQSSIAGRLKLESYDTETENV
jgi:hypothetical protein